MLRIFISYAHSDNLHVQSLVEFLDDQKWDYWYDKELLGGDRWWDTIIENIQSSSLLLFIVSSHSLSSPFCLAEYEFARQCRLHIIPIKFDINFIVGKSNFDSLQETQILTLDPNLRDESLQKLKKSIRVKANKFALPEHLEIPSRPLDFLEDIEIDIKNDFFERMDQHILKLWNALFLEKYKMSALKLLKQINSNPKADSYLQKKCLDLLIQHDPELGSEKKYLSVLYSSKLTAKIFSKSNLERIVSLVFPKTPYEFVELTFRIKDCLEREKFSDDDLTKLGRMCSPVIKQTTSSSICCELARNPIFLKSVLATDFSDFSDFSMSLYLECVDIILEKYNVL